MATVLIIDEQCDLIEEQIKNNPCYSVYKFNTFSDDVEKTTTKEQFDIVLLQFFKEEQDNVLMVDKLRKLQPDSCKFYWLIFKKDFERLNNFYGSQEKVPNDFIFKPITKNDFDDMYKGELISQDQIDDLFG